MRLLPRGAFGRAALLIAAILLVSQIALMLSLRYLIVGPATRQMAEQMVDQIRMLQLLLDNTPAQARQALLKDLADKQAVYVLDARQVPPGGEPFLYYQELFGQVLRQRLGPEIEYRVQLWDERVLWIKPSPQASYWLGMSARLLESGVPGAFFGWLLMLGLSSIVAAFVLARYLTLPLRELARAADELGQGGQPRTFPGTGPTEIRALSQSMQRMSRDLKQNEADRALLFAGISHDLRTPLARMRLAVEMLPDDDVESRQGMVEDIEEMDAIIGHFIASVRDGRDESPQRLNPAQLLRDVAARFNRNGQTMTLELIGEAQLDIRPLAFSRMLSNLLENARRYAGGATHLSCRIEQGWYIIQILDRGSGIAEHDRERVMQAFAHGGQGTGLGLQVSRRIARLHGGELSLLGREGGGLEVRISLPIGA